MSLNQLSETITINVFAISTEGKQYDISMLDVNINDKLQKLVDLLAVDNISGSLVYGSNILNDEKLDQTFAKLFVKNGDKIGVMPGEAAMKDPIKWFRFCDFTNTSCDGIYVAPIYHAISFIPKSKILFMGFG